jgi:hypothetical protein
MFSEYSHGNAQAKDMGNYHPTFKKLFQDPLETNAKHNRKRGLRMGVGSYVGGALRLSKKEIDSVQAGQTSIRTSGRRRNKIRPAGTWD